MADLTMNSSTNRLKCASQKTGDQSILFSLSAPFAKVPLLPAFQSGSLLPDRPAFRPFLTALQPELLAGQSKISGLRKVKINKIMTLLISRTALQAARWQIQVIEPDASQVALEGRPTSEFWELTLPQEA